MKFIFKEETTFEQRKAESSSIRLKYPERVPVIIEKVHGTFVNEMDKKKFLIPSDISMSQLVWIIRKRIHMEPERALYIYVGKTMPLASASLGQVFEQHQDEDGFLYVAYSSETTFGWCAANGHFIYTLHLLDLYICTYDIYGYLYMVY